MHKFTFITPGNEEFFEGFKYPQSFLSFGEVDWDFNMDSVSSNLLILKSSFCAKFLDKVIGHYEGKEDFAVITKVEGEKFTILMTFTNDNKNSLHNYLDMHNEDVIQLLDDSNSTNDCVRALEYLSELKSEMPEEDYKEIYLLLKSQLSQEGFDDINQFAP